MSWASFLIQILDGLAGASSLFLVAAGLSLIFGVSRIVNFAHGSLYMLGMYLAVWLCRGTSFWIAVPIAAALVGVLGFFLEVLLLRRIYKAPELLQLLATFAVLLILRDLALWAWGPEDMLGPRAPGFAGAVEIAGRAFPQYDLLLIAMGPLVFVFLHVMLRKTRWGILIRAATEDREMAGALGVNQAWLFTGVFALGAALAGLGGALAIPREPASLGVDLALISDAFVVVVAGGLGSIPGAFLAALAIGEVKSFCIALGWSKVALVAEFVVMAAVLALRPWGLLGRKDDAPPRGTEMLSRYQTPRLVVLATAVLLMALVPFVSGEYTLVLLTDILVFALFAASLHFLMGPGGMVSFGHAAYFGIGSYGAALLFLRIHFPFELAIAFAPFAAGAAALVFGWFCTRLSGVYLAMLTLAFAQFAWSVAYQWDAVTGGSNGLVGIWPPEWAAPKRMFFWLSLSLCTIAVLLLWKAIRSPFGFALRASRDSPLRAEAVGIDVRAVQRRAFVIAGFAAGLAGALYAFSKGSISPETLAVPRSVDALVMVLLGGLHSLTGPVWGAALFTALQDVVAREFDYWRAALGAAILLLVTWRYSR